MDKLERILKEYDENIKLDKEQIKVLLSNSNKIMVIAGAGAGKTTTIAAKVKYLVESEKIKPDEILIISLTNKAVSELRRIINDALKINCDIYTFHKIAYDIVKKNEFRYKVLEDKTEIVSKLVREDKDTKKVLKIVLKDRILKKASRKAIKPNNIIADLIIKNINLIKSLNISKLPEDDGYFQYLNKILKKVDEIMQENLAADFNDLINISLNCDIDLKYKYIIVDEYQDISQNRLDLLNKIVKANNARLMVVGDDFQTIFSFAGSKTTHFQDFLLNKDVEIIKIVKTYRNSQEIIDIAGSFVMKDTGLIRKKLISNKHIKNPVKIYGYKDNFSEKFKQIVDEIIENNGFDQSILVLGRYKTDIYKLKDTSFIVREGKIIYKRCKKLKIDFLTIHSSKGLGYDNVILINMECGIKGFPSTLENDRYTEKILGYKIDAKEERRLLYVAMTRTKNRFYIITKKKYESNYVKELANFENVVIDYKLR